MRRGCLALLVVLISPAIAWAQVGYDIDIGYLIIRNERLIFTLNERTVGSVQMYAGSAVYLPPWQVVQTAPSSIYASIGVPMPMSWHRRGSSRSSPPPVQGSWADVELQLHVDEVDGKPRIYGTANIRAPHVGEVLPYNQWRATPFYRFAMLREWPAWTQNVTTRGWLPTSYAENGWPTTCYQFWRRGYQLLGQDDVFIRFYAGAYPYLAVEDQMIFVMAKATRRGEALPTAALPTGNTAPGWLSAVRDEMSQQSPTMEGLRLVTPSTEPAVYGRLYTLAWALGSSESLLGGPFDEVCRLLGYASSHELVSVVDHYIGLRSVRTWVKIGQAVGTVVLVVSALRVALRMAVWTIGG